jgi:hypothetical protein
MNKSSKKQMKVAKRATGVPAAYVSMGGSSARKDRLDVGSDIIVDSVLGNANFTCIGYSVNPGLAENFESLSKEAQRYDCYEFQELSFHFVGTTVITTTVGQIGLAFEPNPNSGVPTTQSKFTAYEAHVSSSVYKPDGLWLHIPKHMLAGRRYVRRGIEGSNLTLYDPGSLIVMVRDEAGATTIGYVEVHYKVRFSNFHLEASAIPYRRNVLSVGRAADQTYVTTVPALWDIDTVVSGGLVHDITAGVLTLDSGFYLVICDVVVSDTVNEICTALYDLQVASSTERIVTSVNTLNAGQRIDTFTCLIALSDTSAVELYVTMTGAAGTLKVENQSQIMILAL